MALKKGKVTDSGIDEYLQHQNLLNKADIHINTFAQILNAAKVATAADGGKAFLKKLTEFGGLNEAVIALKQEKQSLTVQVQDLDEKAKLKGALQVDIAHLQVQKKELDGAVSKLLDMKKKTENNIQNLKNKEEVLLNNAAVLNQTVSEKQLLIQNLDKDIKTKQENVADLALLETRQNALTNEMNRVETRLDKEKGRLSVLDGFLALVQSVPLKTLKVFASSVPDLVIQLEQGTYSPESLRRYILKKLTGETLNVLLCASCHATVYVNKPADSVGYACPSCHSLSIAVDQDELHILQEMLASAQPKVMNPVVAIYKVPTANIPKASDSSSKPGGNTKNNA